MEFGTDTFGEKMRKQYAATRAAAGRDQNKGTMTFGEQMRKQYAATRAAAVKPTANTNAGDTGLPRKAAAIERASSAFDAAQDGGVIKRNRFDALAPMRDTMAAAQPVIAAQKELAEAKAPYGAKSAGTTASGGRRVVYTVPAPAEAKKINALEAKADAAQKTFQRGILEKATEGKTAEADHMQHLLQNQRKNLFNINPAYLSEEERAKYNVLYERNPGLADTYLDTIAAEVNARGAREESEKIKSFAKEHPVIGTAANVAGSFLTPLSAVETAIAKVSGRESDPNSIWHLGSRMTEATQEGLTEDIENPFVQFLADTGLSMAQYLSKLPLGGAAALAVMSSGAAGQTAYSARKSGASTGESLMLGTIAGVSEAVLEKLPLDNLLNMFKGADRTGVIAKLTQTIKQPIRDMLGSAVEEGGEEILTEYINTLADQMIRGDNSEMMRYRAELIASGMSESEATKKAYQTYLVTNPLLALAGGALSGGVMAGTAVGSNWAKNKVGTAIQNRVERQNAKAESAQPVQTTETAQETQETAAEGETYADTFADAERVNAAQNAAELADTDVLDDDEIEMLPEWATEDETELRAAAEAEAAAQAQSEPVVQPPNPIETHVLPTAAEELHRLQANSAGTDTARSGYYAGVSDADRTIAETLSKQYGRNIIFLSDKYSINGKFADGTIYLNPNSGNVLAATLAHELTHSVEDSKRYGDITAVVREMYTQSGKSWDSLRREVYNRGYEELYRKQGRTFTDKDADREIVADAVADILGTQEKLTAFAKEHRNFVVRWWAKLKSLLSRFGSNYRGMSIAERRSLSYHKQIADMLDEALRKTKMQSGANGAQYNLVGKTDSGITEQQREKMRELLAGGSLFAPIKYRREIGMSKEEYDRLYEEIKGHPAPKPRIEHQAATKPNKANAVDVEDTQDYRMRHRPDEYGIGYDLTSEGAMPNDFYENPRHYANLNDPATAESYDVLKRIRNKPEADVTIYRAAPVNEFNYGDWVTLSPTYAKRHRDHLGAAGLQVYSMRVKAKDISWAGDDINEFGYFPKTETHTRIRADMSSAERTEALKNRVIENVPEVHELKQPMQGLSSWDDLNALRGNAKTNLIKKLVSEFGAFKNYENSDIGLEFEFTTTNYRESYNKQRRGFVRFAKMFSVLDDVVNNAIGIEVHKREDYKTDPTLKNVYVLMSAYGDGENIVPVKLEVKEFADKPNTLYVAIALEEIKKAEVSKKGIYHEGVAHFFRSADKTEVSKQGTTENGVAQGFRSVVDISIADLMKKVNPRDVSFTKYFPEGMRTEEQTREIDRVRQESGEKYSISAGDAVEAARRATSEAAANQQRGASAAGIAGSYAEVAEQHDLVNVDNEKEYNKPDKDLQNKGKTQRLQTSISDTNSIPQSDGNVNTDEKQYESPFEYTPSAANDPVSMLAEKLEHEIHKTEQSGTGIADTIAKMAEIRNEDNAEELDFALERAMDELYRSIIGKSAEFEKGLRDKGLRRTYKHITQQSYKNTYTQAMMKLYEKLSKNEADYQRVKKEKQSLVQDEVLSSVINEREKQLERQVDNLRIYIDKCRMSVWRTRHETAAKVLKTGTLDNWKDKIGILYAINTADRNIRDISNGDELGKNIIQQFFDPVEYHEAEKNKFLESFRDRIKALGLSRDVKNGNILSESAFTQLYGEAKYNIELLEKKIGGNASKVTKYTRDGRTVKEWRDIMATLKIENPGMDMSKIENAVEETRTIYNELIQALNGIRVMNGYEPIKYRKGYFPHFTDNNSGDGVFVKIIGAMGYQIDVTDVPTMIVGKTATRRPLMRYQRFANARGEYPGESYNGIRLENNGVVEGFDLYIDTAADVIFHTDDSMKLRALSDEIRITTSPEEVKKRIREAKKNDAAGEAKKAYIESILEDSQYKHKGLVVWIENYTNLLTGKKSFNDRVTEEYFGRKFYSWVKQLESHAALNQIGGNISTWLTNIVPLTQAGAFTKFDMLRAANQMITHKLDKPDGLADRSDFLVNRRGSQRLARTRTQQFADTLGTPMEYLDLGVAELIVRSRYLRNVRVEKMGDVEALREADDFAASIMGDRSKGQAPVIFSQKDPLMKLVTMYQLEPVNQLMFLIKDMPRFTERKKLKMLESLVIMAILSRLYNALMKFISGREPAIDPIGLALNIYDDVESGKPVGEVITNAGTDILEQIPFTSVLGMFIEDFDSGRIPVSAAMPNIPNMYNALASEDIAMTKRGEKMLKEVIKPVLYLGLPAGGNQLKKTVEGIATIIKGGSYIRDNKGRQQLQYPLYKDNPFDIARAVVFGKSTTTTGQEWVESGYKTLSVKKTTAYENALKAGASQRDAFFAANNIVGEKIDEKIASLDAMKLDGKVKASLYYDLILSDGSTAKAVMDKIGKTAASYDLLSSFAGLDTASEKTAMIAVSALDATARETVFTDMISDAYTDKLKAVKESGAGFNDFLTVYRAGQDHIGTTKKDAIVEQIDSMNLTKAQKNALYLCFYTETYLNNTPWNAIVRMPELPEISLPELKLPEINISLPW